MSIPLFSPDQPPESDVERIHAQCVQRFQDSQTRKDIWTNVVWHGQNLQQRGAEGTVHIDCQFTEYLRNPNHAFLVFQSSVPISKDVHSCWRANMKSETHCTTRILPIEQHQGSPLYDAWKHTYNEVMDELSKKGRKGVPAADLKELAKWQD